ncbi:hypothetical protein TNCV_4786481 [Trichonephila clavipes]|nr:hypothetical protein TNCV_4786481 [Trichonephila clavipes]
MEVSGTAFIPHTSLGRVSLNAGYKLGGEVENIVKKYNYIGKHKRKAIRELARLARVWFPHFRHGQRAMSSNLYASAELVDIHFLYHLAN